MKVDPSELARVVERCRQLAPARGDYRENDFVTNLLATVVDFQMHTNAVVKALEHYKANRWEEIRLCEDLHAVLARYPDDKAGNTALAQYLWGYNLWTRAHMLRGLVAFFDERGVTDQEALRRWAFASDFKRDFEGQVKGLGLAVYKWLVMRQGLETVKPDVRLRRFTEAVVGRRMGDARLVALLEAAAKELGVPAYKLDWAIWESTGTVPGGEPKRARADIRVGLVGCVKSKLLQPARAKDLYTSALFRGRRSYVEESCDRWFILSAAHGVVDPEAVLEPYDRTLKHAPIAERRRWAAKVLGMLETQLGDFGPLVFEIHAGAEYRDHGLTAGLIAQGAQVEVPAAGLPIGRQLSYYKSQAQ